MFYIIGEAIFSLLQTIVPFRTTDRILDLVSCRYSDLLPLLRFGRQLGRISKILSIGYLSPFLNSISKGRIFPSCSKRTITGTYFFLVPLANLTNLQRSRWDGRYVHPSH